MGGSSSTLLYRDAHWPVPRYLLNLIPFQWGTYSRLGHFMLHASHDMTAFATWFHAVLVPLKWLFWRIVELMFRVQFRLSGEAVPDTPIEIDLFTGGQILTYEYRNMLKAGRVSRSQRFHRPFRGGWYSAQYWGAYPGRLRHLWNRLWQELRSLRRCHAEETGSAEGRPLLIPQHYPARCLRPCFRRQ